MEISINKLRASVVSLRAELQQVPEVDTTPLQQFLSKEHYSSKDLDALFAHLSSKLLDERYTIPIGYRFQQYLPILITTVIKNDEQIDSNNFANYQKKSIALAKLVHLSTDAKRFASTYFINKPAPFQQNSLLNSTPKPKKSKTEKQTSTLHPLAIIKCIYQLLQCDPVYYKDLWNWSTFIEEHLNTKSQTTNLQQIYTNHILAILTNMTPAQLRQLNAQMPTEQLLAFDEEQIFCKPEVSQTTAAELPIDQLIDYHFNSDLITNVEGVLLPIFKKENYKFYTHTDGSYDKIVKVDSTKVNLRSISLGIASGKAICLSGPVGCGKTTLVEYLARKTGRICPKEQEVVQQQQALEKRNEKKLKENKQQQKGQKKQAANIGTKRKNETSESENLMIFDATAGSSSTNGFLRIQLGDQTDSKMLLGQYRCTDVPGEFIWLPGVLTQAVMNGYWLLLEDLDSATQDTYTILSSLLENNYLSVPGFRDCVKIEPGFQLFVTVRTNKSSINSAQKSLYSLLEKYLYTINILPLSRNELCKVISTNYPKLSTVANRIVDVFLTFSSGDHTVADNLRQQETSDKADTTEEYVALPFEQVSLSTLPNSGRLVSTRDLVKLCQRSNPMFSVTSTECAYFVFQNAVDVFCSYLPQGKEKTKLIISIGAKLGIIQSRCEHFAIDYKPEVAVSNDRIKVGRAEIFAKDTPEDSRKQLEQDENDNDENDELLTVKRPRLNEQGDDKPQATMKIRQITTTSTFSFTRISACILERIAVCVSNAEPVLLVGETGVGKTSSVQYLAERTLHKLVVVNMNNQSDVSDLVGGFKPVDLNYVVYPLRVEFEQLFRKTFNQMKNESFLTKFVICYNQGNFNVLVKLMLKIVSTVEEKEQRNELRDKELLLLPRWAALKVKLQKLNTQLSKSINISFAFIPGSLVNCIKNGDWVLLDEINLATAETLECLSTILEPNGSVVLLEMGDFTPVKRHPDFRIFACMNPNTDIGKKDLPVGIRNRFTEFFVDELTTDSDLSLLISDYLSRTGIQRKSVTSIVKLYKRLKQLAKLELNDGLGNRPVYSLRTLCRSLRICAKNLCGSIERNLYESFCMSFLTQLDSISHSLVLQLIREALLSNPKAVLSKQLPQLGEDYLDFEGYWIQQGPEPLQTCEQYILTPSVKENLKDLARIISIGKLPILLQGPTSAGKTSLIEYVAKRSGNHCLRINNHEHTDLQEYIGTYAADVTGKLSFREGVLAQAMRNGYWIILDELNLASTDILEALNRVLDDNRELFIPETQTVIKAHPNFMLFATQNPPGLYGGRKTLSRAFKNRFIELHFSEIPRAELETILEKRCLIPASYAKKMVICMSELQMNRKTTSKNVFTLRDLFRWGNRYTFADKKLLGDKQYDWNQHLIEEGYLVLSAKVRTAIEIEIIEETLYKNFRKRVDLSLLFDVQNLAKSSPVTRDILKSIAEFRIRKDIVWTRNMTRMAVLTAKALQFDEPVLLVGPTGCGKTTVCQLLAGIRGVQLRILNCHMHTEGADFLGGLRPCRQTSEDSQKLFEWADGPLIHAMQEGSYFMADEISLAEDSVLERLNCILEPERTVLLAEKGGVAEEGQINGSNSIAKDFIVKAANGFQFLATMNPGGDFGKKELSPALRNRFTEIWCLPSDSKEDLVQIASNCMLEQLQLGPTSSKEETQRIANYLVEIVLHIRSVVEKFKFSVRDILAWANYIVSNAHLSFAEQAIFGLETVFLDALEMLPHESAAQLEQLKLEITNYAIEQAAQILNERFTLDTVNSKRGNSVELSKQTFGIRPFFIDTNPDRCLVNSNKQFLFEAPTTKQNLFRLLSALSLKKPVLLEGPPGVGKTSIVESIAHAIGYDIVRINLCEHTDLADLFGTDLPAEDNALNEESDGTLETDEDLSNKPQKLGSFVWRDGPLLAALKAPNTWILLDELNLAPQSVLEGLNAILDHRGEVYIPELNKSFALSQQTRIFACQNPLKQGGGRKGLPQSFLNRFNKVYLRKLSTEDLLYVVNAKYADYFEELRAYFLGMLTDLPLKAENLFEAFKEARAILAAKSADSGPNQESSSTQPSLDLAARLVQFSESLDMGISAMEFGYKGGPFEINLRDILRWCDLLINPETGFITQSNTITSNTQLSKLQQFTSHFETFLLTLYERMKLVYYQRMRSEQDKLYIRNAFSNVFGCDAELLNSLSEDVSLYWTDEKIYLNDIVLKRDASTQAVRSLKGRELAPLLLNSQREIFKNLIECIHMEKPVLLCGSTDTGKTKLIDALCQLSNQVCNTDNIDDSVTGSFQQIDFNRHLEEIAQNVEVELMGYLQQTILCQSGTKTLARLFDKWSDYQVTSKSKIEFTDSTATSQELQLFRHRIQTLKAVLAELTSVSHSTKSNTLEKQQRLLQTLERHVSSAESLNTGGSFEWVDSKIVKALKTGQYILLEHVNLCSSAVLDRLNPVFEPNGSLLISEKGVTASDTAELVKKAPNFRAFLTIDPKNGELSRAMRNRCIELALSKDSYSVDDMRAIIHAQGVLNIQAINRIIRIHERIVQLSEISNYSISHLTQFAFLTASYKLIGYAMSHALYVSGMEVYVYAANTDLLGYGLTYYQNKLRELVLEETNEFASEQEDLGTTSDNRVDSLQNVMLNCSELSQHTLVKLQLEPLRAMLSTSPDVLEEKLAQLFYDFGKLKLGELEHSELLRNFIYMLYESSSMDDVQLRFLYLQKLLSSHPELLQLSERLYQCVQQFEKHFQPVLSKLPWNARLYPRIRDYAAQLIQTTHHKAYCLSSTLLARLLLNDIPQLTSESNLVLGYSQAVIAKRMPDKYKNAFLTHLSTFLTGLQDVLYSTLQYAHFDLISYVQLITAYQWINRLLEVSLRPLNSADVLDKLILHFKWLEKHLLSVLSKVLPNYAQLNTEFAGSLQQLISHVISIKQPLNLMRKMYAKQMTQFQPFYLEEQTKIYTLVQQLNDLLSVVPSYGAYEPDLIIRKFVAQQSVPAKRALAILQQPSVLQYTNYDYKFKETTFNSEISLKIPEKLKAALQKFMLEIKEIETTESSPIDPADFDALKECVEQITQDINSDDLVAESEKPSELQLAMQALKEFFVTKALLYKLSSESAALDELNATACDDIQAQKLSAHCQVLNLLKSQKHKSFNLVWFELQTFIRSIESEEEFEQLFSYLNGNYRQFTSYQRLILKTFLQLQLSNLSTHLQCTQILSAEATEVDSRYSYSGPSYTNALLNLLFHKDGSLKSVPLNELENWKSALQEMRQLVWLNSYAMSPSFNRNSMHLQLVTDNAQRLLHELGFVNKLCSKMENDNFGDYNAGFQQLIQSLTEIHKQLKSISSITEQKQGVPHISTLYQQQQYLSSMAFALCGGLELSLLTFTPLIDPVEKNRLKNLYVVEDINCLTTLSTVYDFMKIIMSYKHFGHELYHGFLDKLEALKAKQLKLAQKMALRPQENCLYSSLVQDINHYLKTNCEPLAIAKLLENASNAWTTLSKQVLNTSELDSVIETLKRLDFWLGNAQRFVRHTLKRYQEYYQDFLQPLQCSIGQLQFGLEGLKIVLTQLHSSVFESGPQQLSSNINSNGRLHKVLLNIVEFPSCQQLQVFNARDTTHQQLLQSRSAIFSLLEKIPGSDYEYFRLLKAKLIELNNSIDIAKSINESEFQALDFTFSVCNQVWQQEEDRRRKQKAEEESLYVTKRKCETEDEELIEQQEIAENFPTNIEEDFGDFMVEDTLEKVMKLDKDQKSKKSKNSQEVRDEDYAFIARRFIDIMLGYTQVYYYQQQPNIANKKPAINELEFIEPFQQRLRVFTKLYGHYKLALNDALDEQVYNSLCFAIGLQQHNLNEISLNNRPPKAYNFYKDSNIEEIMSCTHILDTIEERVAKQLELYAEHASLMDIQRVIARIRQLPATSPIVRYNTGFQILRQKVAQWNEVAHKGNHLRDEEVVLAEYVQKWTKLELQYWRNCLADTYAQVEGVAYKYWFFIYNLIQEYIMEHELDVSYTDLKYTEKRFGEGELLDESDTATKAKISWQDIIKILRQFVEGSSYGDFHVRLQLLQAFELYLNNIPKLQQLQLAEEARLSLIAGLRNLQIYFAQFSQEIEETKKSMKQPIEKKLKEFVKIESYNKDLSYFSMRNNVARVHRNLNKFLKEYRLQLTQKVTPVFQPKDATVKDYQLAHDKGKDLRHESSIKYSLVDVKYFLAPQKLSEKYALENIDADSDSLLAKLGKHFATSRNVVKETITNAQFPQLVIALDELFTQQLERCEHLRSLSVDRSKERPKQILEAKQILQQKRKGLTDLFKSLAQLGLSYKAGLMESTLRTEFENNQLPPFCIKSMLGSFKEKHLQSNIVQLNENLDMYFAKCTFKLKLLQNIMLTPLSELGPPNIERIKGYAVDLYLLMQQQRELLAGTTKSIYDLRSMLQGLKEVAELTGTSNNEIKPDVLDFETMSQEFDKIKAGCCRIRYVFEQFNVGLLCMPSKLNDDSVVLIGNAEPLLKNTPTFNALSKACDSVLIQARTLLSDMAKVNPSFLQQDKLKAFQETYTGLLNKIRQIREYFKCSRSSTQPEYLPMAAPLIELVQLLDQAAKTEKLNGSMEPELNVYSNVDTELENIIHSILISLQKLYKKYPKPTPNNSIDESQESPKRKSPKGPATDDEESEATIQEQHLKQKLHNELQTDWSLLNITNILMKLKNIMLTLKFAAPSNDKINCTRKIVSLLPILEQYHLMTNYYLFQQLSAHKVTAKMLSVILTVFVEISTKGFCVPPDLMQDEEGQAKNEQKEGEGFGLEDGTGEKDASEKIESEDQLDDAKRPEDRKDEDDQKQEDCKEEKGIEMSDDFDGKMQDIEKPENEEDDSGESEDEEELNKEMGDTEEGAEKLDEQIWGDDEEEQPEEEQDKEMEDEEGKGNKDEKETHNDLDTKNESAKEEAKDEHEKDGLDATNEPSGKEDKRKEQKQDIDSMKEPEIDEEQVNPYHNELEEPPEPEEMDLGDMNDNGENDPEDEQQNGDENPFDIDAMKENMQTPEETGEDENEDDKEGDDKNAEEANENSDSEDENDPTLEHKEDKNAEADENEKKEDDEEEKQEEAETQKRGELNEDEQDETPNEEDAKEGQEEKPEEYAQSKDKSSKEENVQTIPETEQQGSADQVEMPQSEDKNVKQEQKMDEQDTGEEKDGVGQAENEETDGGHQGIAETKETVANEERKQERQTEEKRKQGRTNEERTLGEAEKNKLKQLKTIDKLKEQNGDNKDDQQPDEDKDVEAEEYQHVKEPKNSDKTTLDNATEEQSKKVQHQEDEEDKNEADGENNDEEQPMDVDETNEDKKDDEQLEEMAAEKFDQKSDKPSKSEKTNERAETNEPELEIEGEVVPTMNVPRSVDTTAHCIKEILLDTNTHAQELSAAESLELRRLYQQQLTTTKATLPEHEDYETWQSISNRMSQNARELCEQLRLILEPTKCTRLKGDYRTGRRINMKKIIPYIASQFRKDKIWLRRTKPAQRDYKITIAIDDSKSMHHNNSKNLTLEAISLVSQALTLLESGRLSIVSFGEAPQIILNHTEQLDGPKLVNALNFSQDKTKIAELLDFMRTINAEEGATGSDNGLFENLLLVLSDGRNIFSEGKAKVKNAIKLARLQRMFLVYIIIDNPENKNSILDIQTVEVLPDKRIDIKSYLDEFPFPYYVIVRDLNQLPLVLSEAMRQWFELVNSEQ